MKLSEILTEANDYAKSTLPNSPEIKLPIYTKQKFDYGDNSNKLSVGDLILKGSDTGNIYGRRKIVQRTLKAKKGKTEKPKNIK